MPNKATKNRTKIQKYKKIPRKGAGVIKHPC